MRDQVLFQELASCLIDGVRVKSDIYNMLIIFYRNTKDNTKVFWRDEKLSSETSFSLNEGLRRTSEISRELYDYYHSEKLGDWNIMHFKLLVNEDRFQVVFDKELGFESDEITVSDYIERFM